MTALSQALGTAWWAVAVHLWQTTLVLIPLLALAGLVRGAPGRIRGLAWGAALLKIVLPLGVAAWAWRLVAPAAEPAAAPAAYVVAMDVLAPRAESASGAAWWPVPLTALWLAGAAALAWRMARAGRGQSPSIVQDAAAEARLSEALHCTGVPRERVRLVQGGGPCVRGVARPCIDVPAALGATLDREALRSLLLHEAAHVARREPLRELGRRLVLIALWFYPPAWLVLRGLRSAAEIDCDDRALQRGATGASLGEALAASVRFGLAAPASMGARRPRSLLRERFRRLDDPASRAPSARHRVALACAALVVAASVLAPAIPAAARGALPAVTSLRVAPLRLDPRQAGIQPGADIVALVGVTVGASGAVEQVTYVHVDGQLPEEAAAQLEEAARAVASELRFAANELGERSDAVVELVWQVGTSLQLGSGSAAVEPTADGARAVIPPPSRITEGMVPPKLVKQVEPDYPADLKHAGTTGLVVCEAVIGADGSVTDVRILRGAEGLPSLDESALAAVRQWIYEPATRDGVPVAVTLIVRIHFNVGSQRQ